MTKKVRNLVITGAAVAVIAAVSIVCYHLYRESQKSGLEKGTEKAVKATENAGTKAVDWTERNVNKAAKETKKFFGN